MPAGRPPPERPAPPPARAPAPAAARARTSGIPPAAPRPAPAWTRAPSSPHELPLEQAGALLRGQGGAAENACHLGGEMPAPAQHLARRAVGDHHALAH